MKQKPTGKKLSEKVAAFADKANRERITKKHAEDSSACEGIYLTPEGEKRAEEILVRLNVH